MTTTFWLESLLFAFLISSPTPVAAPDSLSPAVVSEAPIAGAPDPAVQLASAAPTPGPSATLPAPAKPAPASPSRPDEKVTALVDRMQAFYEGTRDFTARFTQRYTYQAIKRTQTSKGTVRFQKPGKMRWDYESPAPKTFLLAGDSAYAHDPVARTLTKTAVDQSQLSASVTFLWGRGKLSDEFVITREPCASCEGTLLVLDPRKPDPRFRQVRLEVDPKTAQVLESTVIDPDGSRNEITFSGLKRNVGLVQDDFKLRPPAGTQVLDLTRQPQ